jgi:hypothetical protein
MTGFVTRAMLFHPRTEQEETIAMKPDSMLVEPEHIVSSHEDVAARGCEKVLGEVGSTEPALASFIHQSLASVAGKLALSGAPTPLVQGSHEEVLTLILTCIQALRRGHYELWKDTLTGSRLAQLDPASQAKSKGRRRKKQGPTDGQEGKP